MNLRCPACHSTRTRAAFGSASRFQRCRACGSLFDAVPPSDERMAELYSGREYFVKDDAAAPLDGTTDTTFGYPVDYLADRPYIEQKFTRVLGHIGRYVRPGRLLDVGAGPGFLVSAADRLGWRASGLDLNRWAVEWGRDELGVDLRHGRLDADAFPGEQFDAITLMDVIEHLPTFDEVLAEAASRLRAGGVLAVLTPDAGGLVSRALGRRWMEVIEGEHAVLFTLEGLAAALRRHGFSPSSWHTVGKEAPLSHLVADATQTLPAPIRSLAERVGRTRVGQHVFDVDPRTKVCLYARRVHEPARPSHHRPARVPKDPAILAGVEQAIVDELGSMAESRRLCDWMYDAFGPHVPGSRVFEVGAGIGTFTRRMLDDGAVDVLAMEPEDLCAKELDASFEDDPRVLVSRDALPDAPVLADRAGHFDLVVCHNVLEHIGDDDAALRAMHRSLRPGGRLSLLVPARPALFGGLDDAYGHWRRYTEDELEGLLADTGFELTSMRHQNALGILGWWTKNRRPGGRVDRRSLQAYEVLVGAWRPLEERLDLPVGLSLVCDATKPG